MTTRYCKPCERLIPAAAWEKHVASRDHKEAAARAQAEEVAAR